MGAFFTMVVEYGCIFRAFVTAQHRHMGFRPSHRHAEAVQDTCGGGRRSTSNSWRCLAGVFLFRVGKTPLSPGQAGAVDGVPSLFRAVRLHKLSMTELPNIGTQPVLGWSPFSAHDEAPTSPWKLL